MSLSLRSFSTSTSSSSNLQVNRENNQVTGKMTRAGTQRAALGDIGNKVKGMAISNENTRLQKIKNAIPAKSKPAFRANAIKDSVKPVVEVKPTVKKAEEKTLMRKIAEEKPMDISASEESSEAFSAKLLPPGVEDIDKDDADNPQLVSECVKDIYKYLRFMETKFSVRKDYLSGQTVITGKIREVLIDWLVQVHLRFRLLPETLYLTVDIIDRFLQDDIAVDRSHLQLVGVAAMFIASKYEEIYAPEIEDFVFITDKTYDSSKIRQMERRILRAIEFNLGRPLPLHFLRRNSKAGHVDTQEHTLAKYMLELTLPEYNMRHHNPSQVAAAALYLSLRVLTPGWNSEVWDASLVYYSGYTETQILPVVRQMAALVDKVNKKKSQSVKQTEGKKEKNKLLAVAQKFASTKLMSISTIPQLRKSPLTDLIDC